MALCGGTGLCVIQDPGGAALLSRARSDRPTQELIEPIDVVASMSA